MSTTLRLGILGAGAMGARIAAGAARSGRFEVSAVADPDAARAGALASRLGAAAHPSAAAVEDVDAVYVGTPNDVRVDVCQLAAERGWHLLIDKPLCTTAGEADEIAALAGSVDRVWMVGFSYRFRAEWRRARDLIAEGVLGRPLLVTDVIVEAARSTPAWYWDGARGGGVLALQSHHCFDRIRWLTGGPVTPLSCVTSPPGVDRAAAITGRLANGGTASIALGFALEHDGAGHALLVAQGDAATIAIDGTRTLTVTDAEGTRAQSFAEDDWLVTELGAFATAITAGGDYPGVADGRAALDAALAAAALASEVRAEGAGRG